MAKRTESGRQATQTLLRPCPPSAASSLSDTPPLSERTSARPHAPADTSALKLELLAEMRKDIADIFKTELHAALGEDLSTIKSELQAVKTLLTSDRAATDAEMDTRSNTQSPTPPSPQEDMQKNTVDSAVQTYPQDFSVVSPCEVPDWSSSVEIGSENFSHRFEVSPEHDFESDYDIIKICQQLESESQWLLNSSDYKGFLNNEACASPESLWSDSSSVDELDDPPQYIPLGSDFTNTTEDIWSFCRQLSSNH